MYNIKIKNREDIPILKDIPIVMVDKYWFDVADDFKKDISVGYLVKDEFGSVVSTVIEYRKEENIAMMQLIKPVNYFGLIQYGVQMNQIIFDLEQRWFGVPEVDLSYEGMNYNN